MTSLEEFAEAKKSGRYHPATLENWPEKSDVIPDVISPNTPPLTSPIYEEKPEKNRIYTNNKNNLNWFNYSIIAWLIILTIAIIMLHNKKTQTTALTPFKEAPPKVILKTKVEKVYVAKSDDKWRKKLCYGYGDWNACLAYKTNLPFRSRVGRTDLN